MRLYLDEDSVQGVLVILLRNAGHDVQIPVDANMVSEPDAVQLTYAVKADRVLISRNHDDFWDLHKLVRATGGAHPGILIVCRENYPQRDMTPRSIVRAFAKLLSSGGSITNEFTILNNWR